MPTLGDPHARDRHYGVRTDVVIDLDQSGGHGHKRPAPCIDNMPGCFVLESAIHGFGLWAGERIVGDSELCRLDGQRVRYGDYKQMTHGRTDLPFIEWNALSPEVLLVRFFRTKYSYINHSRQPNCRVLANDDGVVILLANRNIEPGEELTLDYRLEPLPSDYLIGHGSSFL